MVKKFNKPKKAKKWVLNGVFVSSLGKICGLPNAQKFHALCVRFRMAGRFLVQTKISYMFLCATVLNL